MLRFSYLFFLKILFCSQALAQEESLPYVLYTIRDGLANQQVRAFMEDSRGYIWTGTNGGLSRFDGHTIKACLPREGFSGKPVYPPILEAPDGSLWYRCMDAVYRFDGITESALPMTASFWETVDPVLWPLIETRVRELLGARFPVLNRLSDNNITLRDVSGGCIIVDYTKRVYHRFVHREFAGTRPLPDVFTADFSPESTFSFLLNKQHEYYAFSSDSILKVASFDYVTGKPLVLHPLAPRDFHFTAPFGSSYWYRRANEYFKVDSGSFNRVDKGFADSKGRVFIATDQGMAVLYPNGPRFIRTDKARYPWSVITDNNETVWIGSYLDGFIQLDMNRHSSKLTPLPSDNKLEHQVFPGKLKGAGDELIFGGYRGLYILKKGNCRFLYVGETVETIVFDAVQNCYYAAGENLSVIDRDLTKITGKMAVPLSVTDGVGLSSVKLSSDGHIWAAGKQGIACIRRNGQIKRVYDLKFPCVCLEQDENGALWAGTGSGLFRYSAAQDSFVPVATEVVGGVVNCLVTLPGNRLAVVTDLELIVLDVSGSDDVQLLGFWSEMNGFQLLGASDNGSSFDGRFLWIPASTGIQRIAEDFLNNTEIFESRLRIDRIDGKRIALSDTFPQAFTNSASVSLDLSLINSVTGEYVVEYRCGEGPWLRLAGLNEHISGLSHGENLLQFRVRTPGTTADRWPVASLRINATLPLIQRGIFKVLLAAIILALAFTMIAWFRRRQLEKNLLNQLDQTRLGAIQAQLNPHILFNLLGSLQNSVANRSREEASDHLVRISRLIRDTLEISISSSDHARTPFPVISVSKEIDFLKNYLGLEAMQQHPPFDFLVKAELSSSPDFVSIPPLLVQPLVENAVIHGIRPMTGKKCAVEVVFREEADTIVITIADDGIGIAHSVRSRSLRYRSRGSELLEKRLYLLGKLGYPATVSVQQRETGGTIAEIRVRACSKFSAGGKTG